MNISGRGVILMNVFAALLLAYLLAEKFGWF